MNAFRKSVCLAIALLAAVFSSIAWSQSNENKHFIFNAQAGTPSNTQIGSHVTVEIINDNPSGSSAQIGSFFVTVSANVSSVPLVITGATKTFGPRGGTISISPDGTSITVTGINPLKAGDRYVLDVIVNGCGDAYPWTAQAWSGPTLNGNQYFVSGTSDLIASADVDVPCGVLSDCTGKSYLSGQTVNLFIASVTDNKGKPLSRRGLNQDGSTCSDLNYFVTDVPGALHIRWNNGVPASLFYVLKGGTNKGFSWKTDPITGDPVFVAPQVCDQGKKAAFPSSYGTLATDVSAGSQTITLTKAANTPPTPFRIAVGLEISHTLEFLTVTNVSQGTWTLGDSTTKQHFQGEFVMSSPVPALPDPPVCVNSDGIPLTSCPDSTYVAKGPALMCYVPTNDTSNLYIFDIGDGWTLGR